MTNSLTLKTYSAVSFIKIIVCSALENIFPILSVSRHLLNIYCVIITTDKFVKIHLLHLLFSF